MKFYHNGEHKKCKINWVKMKLDREKEILRLKKLILEIQNSRKRKDIFD